MNNNPNGLIAPKAIENDGGLLETFSVPAPVAAPDFDAAQYWSYLDGVEASDTQKAALLAALWSIMARFVEIGFGVDPVQTVIPVLIRAALADEDTEQPSGACDAFDAVCGPNADEDNNNKTESGDDH